jgi:SAM-dependent methyltransferase
MAIMGILGGPVGYHLLRWIGRHGPAAEPPPEQAFPWQGKAYAGRSKLEALFGPRIWAEVAGKVVVEFGCADGAEAISMALHGARKVIGIDNRESVLEIARRAAAARGVADRCVFSTHTDERADVIFSIDWFEHYDDVEGMLRQMRKLIKDDGRVHISFGPSWYHPLGGHLFSTLPWSHLVFTEKALIRWRSDFKSDGATRFCEVEGGLNQMTIGRFERLLAGSDFWVEQFDTPPIKKLRILHNRLTREFFTSFVRCTLAPAR